MRPTEGVPSTLTATPLALLTHNLILLVSSRCGRGVPLYSRISSGRKLPFSQPFVVGRRKTNNNSSKPDRPADVRIWAAECGSWENQLTYGVHDACQRQRECTAASTILAPSFPAHFAMVSLNISNVTELADVTVVSDSPLSVCISLRLRFRIDEPTSRTYQPLVTPLPFP